MFLFLFFWFDFRTKIVFSNFAIPIGIDDHEIQRQNRITAQIVANYLERRLFPFKKPTNRLPTVDEILPPTMLLQQQQRMQFNESDTDSESESKHKITRHLQHGNQDTDINDDINVDEDYINDDQDQELDPENLQSVESNHFDSYYPEETNEINEGRCFQFEINIFFYLS